MTGLLQGYVLAKAPEFTSIFLFYKSPRPRHCHYASFALELRPTHLESVRYYVLELG